MSSGWTGTRRAIGFSARWAAELVANGYDVAQICLNGHVINDRARTSPEFNSQHCKHCGTETITACTNCKALIRGEFHSPVIVIVSGRQIAAPTYCHQCGAAYPWT